MKARNFHDIIVRSALVLLVVLVVREAAYADCGKDQNGNPRCGTGQCVNDKYGKVICSPKAGGGCATDNHGEVTCGEGQCLTDQYGKVVCSKTQGGGCATDLYGKVICN